MKTLLPSFLRGLWRVPLLILGLLSGGGVAARGPVDVNIRGLVPPRWVSLGNPQTGSETPLVGTNFVAQIVYGPSPTSMTQRLGGPMPFRVPSTLYPGTWNPRDGSLQDLVGFEARQTAWLQVWVWDSLELPSLEAAQQLRQAVGEVGSGWMYGCRLFGTVGVSAPFPYVVGDRAVPSSLQLANLGSFTAQPRVLPDFQGPMWQEVLPVPGDTRELVVDFLSHPSLSLPPEIRGDAPVGAIFRAVSVGNPFTLIASSASVGGLRIPSTEEGMAGASVSEDQTRVVVGPVTIEGVVSNAVVRIQRPMLGRIQFVLRHAPEDWPFIGCSSRSLFVVDLQPIGPTSGIWVSRTGSGLELRLRLEATRTRRLLRSRNLRTWEELATVTAGIESANSGFLSLDTDRDRRLRSADFLLPTPTWMPSADNAPVFLRLE